jgi:hypothetical protein
VQRCACIKTTRKRDSNFLARREFFEDIGHGSTTPKQDSAKVQTDIFSILRVKSTGMAVLICLEAEFLVCHLQWGQPPAVGPTACGTGQGWGTQVSSRDASFPKLVTGAWGG